MPSIISHPKSVQFELPGCFHDSFFTLRSLPFDVVVVDRKKKKELVIMSVLHAILLVDRNLTVFYTCFRRSGIYMPYCRKRSGQGP